MTFGRTLQGTEARENRQSDDGKISRTAESFAEKPRARLLRPSLLSGVVPGARAYCQLAVALRARLDMDRSIPGHALRSCRLVSQRVLVADIVGDAAADFVYFIQRLGEEGHAAGAGSYLLKGASRSSLLLFPEQADGIDGRAVLSLQPLNGSFQRLAAGVILAVGHHENYLLLQARILLEVVSRCDQRIV